MKFDLTYLRASILRLKYRKVSFSFRLTDLFDSNYHNRIIFKLTTTYLYFFEDSAHSRYFGTHFSKILVALQIN